jgi:hypothetical protein
MIWSSLEQAQDHSTVTGSLNARLRVQQEITDTLHGCRTAFSNSG